IWLNSAGNNHGLSHAQRVLPLNSDTGFVRLPGPHDTLRFENKLDNNNVSVTLSWSDFAETENFNTQKDLDLLLYNSEGALIPTPNKIQRGEAPVGDDTALSSHARE